MRAFLSTSISAVILSSALAFTTCIASGCSAPETQLTALSEGVTTRSIKPAWKTRLNGYPTDIALDSAGNELGVATIPATDRVGGARKNQIFWLGSDGQVRWRIQPTAPTRSISMARDGSLLVVNSYDDEILAYGPRGNLLWSARGDCQPHALSSSHLILCYHDDDADPSIAFDVYDWNGRMLFTREVASDIVAFKVSLDEKSVAIGLTHGKVLLFGGNDFHPLAHASVSGEITDVSPANGGGAAALYRDSTSVPASGRKPVRLAWVSPVGSVSRPLSLDPSVSQISVSALGDVVYAYGNSDHGQYVAALTQQASHPGWFAEVPSGARYDQQIIAIRGGVVTAFDNDEGNHRVARVHGYDSAGKLEWAIPVETDENAYLYGLSVGEAGSKLAVAVSSDDGRIAVYRNIH